MNDSKETNKQQDGPSLEDFNLEKAISEIKKWFMSTKKDTVDLDECVNRIIAARQYENALNHWGVHCRTCAERSCYGEEHCNCKQTNLSHWHPYKLKQMGERLPYTDFEGNALYLGDRIYNTSISLVARIVKSEYPECSPYQVKYEDGEISIMSPAFIQAHQIKRSTASEI